MNSKACELLGIEFPLFAFSHCRDVVAGVSSAGGFGVLGAAGHTPETLEIELDWIDGHVGGKPYGVDLLVPTSMDSKERGLTREELEDRIPIEHKRYIESLLANHDIDTTDLWEESVRDGVGDNMRESGASRILDVAFSHPIGMVVNALGVPPDFMMSRAREAGVAVGALAGAREHAIKHAEAGIDVVIVAGTEAGGTAARCRPWCWSPKCSSRSATPTWSCSPPAASSPAGRWRPAWPWAPTACGPGPCG